MRSRKLIMSVIKKETPLTNSKSFGLLELLWVVHHILYKNNYVVSMGKLSFFYVFVSLYPIIYQSFFCCEVKHNKNNYSKIKYKISRQFA